jgi:hypothetical protein
MKVFIPLVLGFAAVAPVPGPERPHPIALRRERLNRQLAHTRGRKGHR